MNNKNMLVMWTMSRVVALDLSVQAFVCMWVGHKHPEVKIVPLPETYCV